MVYGVIFTHLVALFPAEIIQLNRQYEGSIILDIQPKMKFFILFLNAWNNASRESLILIVTQKRNTIGVSLKNSCWRLGCEFLSHKMKLLLFSNLLIYSFMFNSPFI